MTDNDTKTFTLAQILTVTHGRLLVEIGGVYEILNWLTGDELFTHQLPRASREAEGPLLGWFPELKRIDVGPWEISTEADVDAYMAELAEEYGTTREVPRLSPADHTAINPLAELAMHFPDTPVIVVKTDG